MRYDVPDDKGETRRDRNQRFGVSPGPEVEYPDSVSHIWQWFWQLSSRRASGESGPHPVSYTEIDAWSRMTGTLITPEEVSMLTAMDSAYRGQMGEEIRAAREAEQAKTPKSKPRVR